MVLTVVSDAQRGEGVVVAGTLVHCAEHASDEFVDSVAFLNEWDEGGDATLVVDAVSEVGEDEFLEGFDLVLECHEVGYGFVSARGQPKTQ